MIHEQIGLMNGICKRGGYETWLKRQTSKSRRKQAKDWLRNQYKPEPCEKQYLGWSW